MRRIREDAESHRDAPHSPRATRANHWDTTAGSLSLNHGDARDVFRTRKGAVLDPMAAGLAAPPDGTGGRGGVGGGWKDSKYHNLVEVQSKRQELLAEYLATADDRKQEEVRGREGRGMN